jgi:tetratricopeptide (TPR) repeat protein
MQVRDRFGCLSVWKKRQMPSATGVLTLTFSLLFAALLMAQSAPMAMIEGSVRDASGAAVADASVRLQKQGDAQVVEHKTNADGTFIFPQLPLGNYLLSADKGEQRSNTVVVNATEPGASRHADLTLENPSPGVSTSGSTQAQSMEFADAPNFTVAGVTDWTAAGGHGSDASLRTSESLTRETLELKAKSGDSPDAVTTDASHEKESRLRAALDAAPKDFDANHRLGKFYLRAGRFAVAIELLENAYQIDSRNEQNEFDLALALKGNGEAARASEHVQKLLAASNKADYHRLAGQLDESLGDPLAAVHEFERAVHADPSEQNYFEWGSDLLLHRAIWQAKDVFTAGAKTYPKSARMLTALGAALFACALYDDAAKRLCEASDLNPADPEPYLFMGKVEMAAPNPLPCVEPKLARFVAQEPGNPLANYYYAMTIWKQHGHATDQETLDNVEALLTKAVTVDPKCGGAYLQLGVLEASRRNFQKAIGYYDQAIEADPRMSEAHYRLGVAYDRTGDKVKAADEFKKHDEIERQQAAEVDRQRKEVKQFLVVVDKKSADATSNP